MEHPKKKKSRSSSKKNNAGIATEILNASAHTVQLRGGEHEVQCTMVAGIHIISEKGGDDEGSPDL